jgi:hypothetical protein
MANYEFMTLPHQCRLMTSRDLSPGGMRRRAQLIAALHEADAAEESEEKPSNQGDDKKPADLPAAAVNGPVLPLQSGSSLHSYSSVQSYSPIKSSSPI